MPLQFRPKAIDETGEICEHCHHDAHYEAAGLVACDADDCLAWLRQKARAELDEIRGDYRHDQARDDRLVP